MNVNEAALTPFKPSSPSPSTPLSSSTPLSTGPPPLFSSPTSSAPSSTASSSNTAAPSSTKLERKDSTSNRSAEFQFTTSHSSRGSLHVPSVTIDALNKAKPFVEPKAFASAREVVIGLGTALFCRPSLFPSASFPVLANIVRLIPFSQRYAFPFFLLIDVH